MKKFCMLLLLVFLNSFCYGADLAGDFDGNGRVTIEDVAYFMAWLASNRTNNLKLIADEAYKLYAKAVGPVVRAPSAQYDNFAGGTTAGLKDIAIVMGWLSENRSSDFGIVRSSAKSLYDPTDYIYKLPGTPVGDSTVPVTITGIQVDNP
ncbi:MAG TPA: hypothetical protein PLK28_10350 [Candidatus Rifleibacterium sp.]|nr:hypothetical protein [Candidatus Rifleibacterium sp.]